jgi:hypothetical protein
MKHHPSTLLLCTLLVNVLLAALPRIAAADWYDIKTADAEIVSQFSERLTAEVVQSVMDYRATLHQVFPRFDLHADPPVKILLLPRKISDDFPLSSVVGITTALEGVTYILDDGAFVEELPQHPGVVVDVNSGITVTKILWVAQDRGATMTRVALRELTHQLLHQAYPGLLPTWFDDGLAEFLSTIQRRNGKMMVGIAPQERWDTLQSGRWMPLQTLLRVTPRSQEYSGKDTDLFYAESWLLIHYAQFANKERWRQIAVYLELIRRRLQDEDAAAQAFPGGLQALDAELQTYARQKTLTVASLDIPQATLGAPMRPLKPAEGGKRVAFMKLEIMKDHGIPPSDVLPSIRDLAIRTPSDPVIELLLANAYEGTGDAAAAQPLLKRRCVEPFTDADVAILCGDAIMWHVKALKDAPAADLLDARLKARPYYEAALRLAPDDLRSLARTADAYIGAPGDSSAVRAGLERHLATTPANYRIAQQLAELYLHVDLQRAKVYADQVLLKAQDPGDHSRAVELTREIDNALAAKEKAQ